MNESDLLNKMADIELPAPPDWQPFMMIAGVVLLIVLAAILIVRAIYKNNKQNASSPVNVRYGKQVLDEIEDKWSTGNIDDREASYRLSTLLRLGLGLPQLSPARPSGMTDDAIAWEKTIQLFDRLRYSKTTQSRLSAEDFSNVRKWLAPTAGDGHHG